MPVPGSWVSLIGAGSNPGFHRQYQGLGLAHWEWLEGDLAAADTFAVAEHLNWEGTHRDTGLVSGCGKKRRGFNWNK